MPEEQAFCVLVKIMSDYGFRNMFKDGFEVLHLRFYQLDRLLEEYLPDISSRWVVGLNIAVTVKLIRITSHIFHCIRAAT